MDNIRFAEGLMSIAHGLNIIAEAISGGGVERLPEEAHQFAVPRNQVDEPPGSPVSEPPVSEKPPTREEVVSYFRGMSQVIGSDAAKAAVAKILAGMDVKAFKDIPEENLGEFLHQLRTVPGAPANA